jgi:transposase InsO family protein
MVGLLQYNNNCNYIFSIIDCTSKWMETIPLSAIFAADYARALVFHWITCFEVPDPMFSDHGPHFSSNLGAELCDMLQILRRKTTTYHPEVNGAVERLHHRLKDALRACAATATWAEEIPWVLLRPRSQPREDSGLPPAEAVFGTPLFYQ